MELHHFLKAKKAYRSSDPEQKGLGLDSLYVLAAGPPSAAQKAAAGYLKRGGVTASFIGARIQPALFISQQ